MGASTAAAVHGRVLVVEDDDQNARLLTRLLRAEGFTVDVAGDGLAALAAVASRAPDVILLDWMLPGVTGLEVCERLKQDETTRLIPIVLMTGLGSHDH